MRCATAIAACLLTITAGSGAMAVEKPPKGSAPVEQGPIYDPRTGSYFELRINNATQPNWRNSRVLAARLAYNGRQGRLAVVRDLETLKFLRENFRFNHDAWIGLQFFCKFRKLLWVTGETQPLNTPGVWAPQWYRNASVRCQNQHMDYMPVYLTREGGPGDVSWQASGPSKVFKTYIVEYPAPPTEASNPDQADEKASK